MWMRPFRRWILWLACGLATAGYFRVASSRAGEDGASDNRPAAESPSDPVAGRSHWAYQPLARPSLPDVGGADWPRTAIDTFVSQKLTAHGLRPAADADRATVLRRVHVQLVGLPPSMEQVASFVAAGEPDAYERAVDMLLSSPRFGERWGRHWLDLARYADSNGLDENFLFREAWRYRNWVIDAVNADLPFDRFVNQQIAGDLLPYDSVDERDRQRVAAGFLLVGPKVLLGNDPNKQRLEVADEQMDTVGRAILGQTLGCARCHDHKFDPIPTADYYALAGIFTSTQVMERRYMLGEQRDMERLVGLGPAGEAADGEYEKYWLDRPKLPERVKLARFALELLEKDNTKELAALESRAGDAVAPGITDVGKDRDERRELQKSLVARLEKALATPPPIPARAMIPADKPAPADEQIRLAGQFDQLGDPVPRGFLRVIDDSRATIPPGHSGRRELGHWLTDVDAGAGRLSARVLANRVWHHAIGRGIVLTVDNFGRTGEAPTHPELLDHLAGRLIDSQWSVKELVRRVVCSRVFTMSSAHDDTGHGLDPDNRWMWRAHRRRLDPECLRDAMLLAADELSLVPMESSVWYLGDQATAVGDNKVRRRTDFPCRSVYLPVIRNDLPELFQAFDFADPHATTGSRSRTMVPTQGLFILNDASVMSAAESAARRLLATENRMESESRVELLYAWILQSRPTAEDRRTLWEFIRATQERLSLANEPQAELRAWSIACHALFASTRFQILE